MGAIDIMPRCAPIDAPPLATRHVMRSRFPLLGWVCEEWRRSFNGPQGSNLARLSPAPPPCPVPPPFCLPIFCPLSRRRPMRCGNSRAPFCSRRQQNGPNHLGLWSNAITEHQTALITSDCGRGGGQSSFLQLACCCAFSPRSRVCRHESRGRPGKQGCRCTSRRREFCHSAAPHLSL